MRRQRKQQQHHHADNNTTTVQLVSISNNNNDTSQTHATTMTMNVNESDNEGGFQDEPQQLPSSPYQRVDETEINLNLTTSSTSPSSPISAAAARACIRNFTLMSFLFSANHGCVVGTYIVQKASQADLA